MGGVGKKELIKFMRIAKWVFQLSSHCDKALEIWTKQTYIAQRQQPFEITRALTGLKQRLISR